MISSVIVTPYFEDLACEKFCADLDAVFDGSMRLVIIDDGSVDRILTAQAFANTGIQGVIVRLKRNLGHQSAIAVGLDYALQNYDFDKLVIMDSDGEDQPTDINSLLDILEQNKSDKDIVVATRKSRQETFRFKIFYSVYQGFFRMLVGRSISFGNFMVMTKKAAARMVASHETPLHVAAAALNSKLRILEIPLDRGARYAGKSKMNLVNLILHGIRSIMVFSEEVIVRITLFCFAVALAALIGLIAMVIMKVAGATIPGWYSTGSGLLMLLLFQIGSMAVLVLLSADGARSRLSKKHEYETVVKEIIPLG